ncbi:winged helix-turn-helix domain-containing protein [Zavarzinia compransoris]|uniref:DNA-binding response regulator n=1 Tax=Zavarzinia compransoris TaxID=1264899 RepID=A0A317E2J8_9PROT|nr:winged helix-turn-helix domain-containing protein [Zavarzinia compransoris]PWR20812.1 DNA-binding response regulator [Zavarzinia compransoris]TDP44352.1 DNA-binding response OmpR family regulator [Zavarzinia compransoris]
MTNRPLTPDTARLLVAVDDGVLAHALADPLREAGFAVTVAPGLADSAAWAAADLVIVDRAAEGGGADAALVAAGCSLPVVALAGADDARPPAGPGGQVTLLRKPLRVEALVKGVRAGLANGAGALAIGPCRLFASSRTLVGAAGEAVRLTDKETQILARLAAAIGRVVPREILLAEVWGYGAAIATHTIETHVYRLRRKLGRAVAGGAGLILAEDGGYRLAVA